jgi:glucosylceramidase
LVTVDPAKKTFKFNHEYYLLKHVSHFVLPGAKRLITKGAFENILAFKNSDGSIACVVQNETSGDKEVKIEINGKTLKPVLPANSFNTFLVKAD